MALATSPARRSGPCTGSSARRIGLRLLLGLLAIDGSLVASACAPHARDREDDAPPPTIVSAHEHRSTPAPTLVDGARPPRVDEAAPSGMYELVREPIGTGGLGERVRWVPRVRIGRASSDAAEHEHLARAIVRGRLREIVACYGEALRRDPGLHGELVLRFRIGRKRTIAAVVRPSPALAQSSVVRCVARRVRRWSFPRPHGAAVTIAVPIVLGQAATHASPALAPAARVLSPPQAEPAEVTPLRVR
ncbi:MAG: AgmX/PglI C-terminal domain-containing protein [Deltaproteobacteria bacterium]|nr:AgmX/PglI C-terminal domain-containing protein [Deltaproteobacteria bacterium]